MMVDSCSGIRAHLLQPSFPLKHRHTGLQQPWGTLGAFSVQGRTELIICALLLAIAVTPGQTNVGTDRTERVTSGLPKMLEDKRQGPGIGGAHHHTEERSSVGNGDLGVSTGNYQGPIMEGSVERGSGTGLRKIRSVPDIDTRNSPKGDNHSDKGAPSYPTEDPKSPHSPGVPCPLACVCNSSAANCSGAGLREIPSAGSCPPHTTLLDLSRNKISTVTPEHLAGFKDLRILDLSNNLIVTLEEKTFKELTSLHSVKLGSNSYLCDCALSWLKDWVQQNAAMVLDREEITCSLPASLFNTPLTALDSPAIPCADSYVSCVQRPQQQQQDAVLLYSSLDGPPHTAASCNALCHRRTETHWSLDPKERCLCGSLPPPSSPGLAAQACREVCSNAVRTSVCGRTVILKAFPVQVNLVLHALRYHSVFQPVELSASTAVPGTVYQWEFGDGSTPLNSSDTRARYKYALPGTYRVGVWAHTGASTLWQSRLITVVMPAGPVELECPLLVEQRHSVEIWLNSERGTEMSAVWSVKDSEGTQTIDDSSCPRGGRVLLTNLHCYWLSQSQESWQAARQSCQLTPGADLVVVSSAEVQGFIQQAFPMAGAMWLGLSEHSKGELRWVDGTLLDSFQNWGSVNPGQNCIQMESSAGGQWRGTGCERKNLFICEKAVAAPLPSVDSFLTGVPVMSGMYPVRELSVLPAAPAPGPLGVEWMVFPGLWFSHAGQLVSVEFVIQPISQLTEARIQILRPYCSPTQHLVPPGCSSLQNPFACCSDLPLCNTTGGCAGGQQWCHLRESCLPVTSPCSSYSLPLPLPPRHTATPPFYYLVAELPLSLAPCTEPTHINVLLSAQEIHAYPDDILALQHDAGPGSLLHCPSSPGSPWRQSFLSLRGPGWWEGGLTALEPSLDWVDETVCDLRVLYTDSMRSYAVTPLLNTAPSQPGPYTYSVAVSNPVSSTTESCTVAIHSRVAGLQIIHPQPTRGNIHLFLKQPALVVIKILAGSNATATWSAPVLLSAAPFQPSCPPEVLGQAPGCKRDTLDTWFSSAPVLLASLSSQLLNITVSNQISSQSLSVALQSHEAVGGLRMFPSGAYRMLVDVSQVFSAEVSRGSSVTFSWVIDDLTVFAYTGQTYNVVFKKPAQYKLKVTAWNPVSSESLLVQLTADLMNPLADPHFFSVAKVMPVNTLQEIIFRVKVDISIDVTLRWDFGDDSPVVDHALTPPYEASLPQPDPGVKQVYLQDSASHTYTQPGDYTVRVQAFNKYNHTEQSVPVKVRSPLVALTLSMTPSHPLVNQSLELEAVPSPSPYGIFYRWNFNDGSLFLEGPNSTAHHSFAASGFYNLTVVANNTLSSLTSWLIVVVGESISNLQLTSNAPNELGSPTVVNGTVSTGTGLTWTFDMGNGEVFTNLSGSFVSYVYTTAGNYTINVIVRNSASSALQSIRVEIYKLMVLGILPLSCQVTGEEVNFQALVNRKVRHLKFYWSFGDGRPLTIVEGNSTVVHDYSSPGSYPVNLTVFSQVGTVSYQRTVCVEDLITALTLNSSSSAVAIDQDVCFVADIVPHQDGRHTYRFMWNSGIENESPINGQRDFCYTFRKEGTYQVSVLASNNVSSQSDNVFVHVQELVGKLWIRHDGEDLGALTANRTYQFTVGTTSGTNVTFKWDFGDGSPPSLGQNFSHTYKTPGTFTVTATGENVVSWTVATVQISVLSPISELILSTSQTVAEVGQAFIIMAKVNIEGNVQFFWSVDPSTLLEEGTSTFRYTFPKPGVYRIYVVAQNLVSKQQASITIEVFERIRGLKILSQDLIAGRYVPTKANFLLTALITQGSNVSYTWTVHLGGTHASKSKGESLTFLPDSPGDLQVALRANNPLGVLDERIMLRAVECVAGVRVLTTRDSVAVGRPVNISVSVDSGTDLQYTWYTGSDQTPLFSNVSFLSHVYSSIGSVIINVTVSNVLGSSAGSTELRVQEPVFDLNFHILDTLKPFYVPSNTTVVLHGFATNGTDLQWEWHFPGTIGPIFLYNQEISYSFKEASMYQVSLNASNDVSWKEVSHQVTVQDTIQGLALEVNRSTVCEEDRMVFKMSVLKGTNITYSLNFTSLNFLVDLQNNIYECSHLLVGRHNVTARAMNDVSSQSESLVVEVVEKIRGLQLVNRSLQVLEAHKEVGFQAQVLSGSHVSYQWLFQILGYPDYPALGQKVFYTPPGDGSLTVSVVATNAFCSNSLNDTLMVQSPVLQATLATNGTDVFTNQTVSFWVFLRGGSDLHYEWNFGVSGKEVIYRTKNNTAVHIFQEAGFHLVEVKVFNQVSLSTAQTLITVRSLECSVPKVILIQGETNILKSRPSYFEASVDLHGCTTYRAGYSWEVFRGSSCLEQNRVPLGSADVSTPLLILPKLTLDLGPYCLRFTAALLGTPLLQQQTLNITVVQSRLVALIRGGSHRVWSAHEDLLLDGTDSHDPDSGVGEEDEMEYQWDCIIQNMSAPSCIPQHLVNHSSLTLSSEDLLPESVYIFTVTVRKAGKQCASTMQTVTVKPGRVLPVSIVCLSCSALSSYGVSQSVHVTLSGHCPSCSSRAQFRWEAVVRGGEEVLDLDKVSTSTGPSFPDLVVRQGVLRDGVNYTFTLSVADPQGALWGSASITLVPNHPPSGGTCILQPDTAIYLLETPVTSHCTGWRDADSTPSQLIFSMVAELCLEGCRQCHRFTLYRGTKPSFSSLLPLGPPGAFSTITVLIQVENSLGAKTTALNRTLSVSMPLLPSGFQSITDWLKNKSQSELWGVVQQGNPQEVIPYSIALISALNQNRNVSEEELGDRISIRSNITRALTSLNISTVQDVVQLSAALAQCVVVPREFVCEECQRRTLEVTHKMISIIGEEMVRGDATPTSTGTNILQILGGSMAAADYNNTTAGESSELAVSAFSLTLALMRSLMRSRVTREEPLSLGVPEIQIQGHRADPSNLLCTRLSQHCNFYIPRALSSQLEQSREVVQILMQMEVNPFSLSLPHAHPISTGLAAMEFTTPQGQPIPIANLSNENAIQVVLPNQAGDESGASDVTIPPLGSVNFTVKAVNSNPEAGLYISFRFTLPPGSKRERNAVVRIYIDASPGPSESQHTLMEEVSLSQHSDRAAVEHTVFLSPLYNDTARQFFVNVSSVLSEAQVQARVTVFSSLCQFFSLEEKLWSTQGLSPLERASLQQAHCLTQHLTVFGASLFIYPDALIFLPPAQGPVHSHVAVITCAILLAIYLATALIAHKLDDIDVTHVGVIPLCGQPGRYRYRVMVKTGWTKGSGTSAHVGISLYGLNKSGSRHLDKEGAFSRNSLDEFQIETDANLGEIWKIRVWHDNTGLDPSWYLQYVIVWDRQTDTMYFFLVEDWLSVENERNEGMVEKEVLAACPQELRGFCRILGAQLLRGVWDAHLWVSVWERPPRSRFTRVQRVTCCALLLYLYLAAGALWYGAVGDKHTRGPVSAHVLVNAETIAVGMTIAALVCPIYLLFTFLFRRTRSKVTVEDPEPQPSEPLTVEMDVFLEHSELGSSSFLSLPGRLDSIMDGASDSSESLGSKKLESALGNPTKLDNESFLKHWPSCDSIFDIPDLLSAEPSVSRSRILKRKKAVLKLGLESPSSSEDDPLSFSLSGSERYHLTLSEEDLIKSIAADEKAASDSSGRVTSDSGRFSPRADTDLSDLLQSSCSGWSDLVDERKQYGGQLHKSISCISGFTSASSFLPSPEPPSHPGSAFSTRIGVSRRPRPWLLPPWVLSATYLLVLAVLVGCVALAVLYGSSFRSPVLLMWLISFLSAFLTSALIIEPAKVVLQALFQALVLKAVDPDEGDTLVEEPLIKRSSERLGKVRAPYGYGLLHAKEEARRVRALRQLMKDCIVHMLFLLVVLVVNYQGSFHDNNGRLLHAAVRHALLSTPREGPNFTALRGGVEAWLWMDSVLVSHLYRNPSLSLVGVPRLRQLHSQGGCGPHGNVGLFSQDRSPTTYITQTRSNTNTSSNQRGLHVSHDSPGLWYWGELGLYCSRGEAVELGNSSETALEILRQLHQASWINTMSRGLFVEFTQYHRDTGLFLVVTMALELPQFDCAVPSLSVRALRMQPSSSGADLLLVMMVLLLVFGVCFLCSELLALSKERWSYLRQGRHYLQLLVSLLCLGVCGLHFTFLSLSANQLRHHRRHRHAFTDFHKVALIAETASNLAAVLLSILTIKIVRQLRFVRKWSVFGKTFQLAGRELTMATLLLLLLLLIFAQSGCLLFSSTVQEFRSLRGACVLLLSALRGRVRLGRVSQQQPLSGPLYLLGCGACLCWVLARLFGAVLMRSYRAVQNEKYRPAMEPQDYEMVEFFIKRFRLWMGLSRTKEFRHKVKFEGMESLPSRSSRDSAVLCPESDALELPRAGSALSSGSEESSVGEGPRLDPRSDLYDVQFYLDRLLPTINSLLTQFDRVNKVTGDLYQIEADLQRVQSKIAEKRRQQVSPPPPPPPPTASPALLPPPPSLSFSCKLLELPRTYTTFSEPALSRPRPHRSQVSDSRDAESCRPTRIPSLLDAGTRRVPGRRAWHSGPPLSADFSQRPLQAPGGVDGSRPKSEEGKGRQGNDRAPVKRRAWHNEGP
ncbi:polycystin-1 isoform X1 [Acipenser ruthenus]|uniref:polycystin-1 isoform X1 n=1 Tax=Acipenser ruthenus TaxID=7906 RepID=UPI002741E586|nr:polycystin-1 isoform X1 [Acipenser ruthenus]